MTMDLVSGLPFQAGSAVAAAGKRALAGAAGWYLRAPLRNSALTLLVSLSAMAASNALYGQQHHHPAPMFGSFSDAPADAAPVLPKLVRAPTKARVAQSTTLSDDTTPISPKALGSDEMIAVQQKLQALNLFTATVDGFYGPRTAKAIKAFEEMMGRKPSGQLTREIIDLIKATPTTASAMSVAPAPVRVAADGTPVRIVSPLAPLEPAPAETPDMAPQADVAPLAVAQPAETSPAPTLTEPTEDALSKPLPAPAPLIGGSNSAPAHPSAGLSLEATGTDEAAEPTGLALAAQPADEASIDPQTTATITSGTEDLQPVQSNGVVKRTVQTIAVRALVPAVDPAPEARTDVASLTVDPRTANSDPRTIAAVQRGLSQLGFLHTEVTGVADEATAKAIRNFEVYYNYDVTGRISADLVKLLAQNGAEL
jgi:peptidoglycan hydrolase-like protein with peptidoglycan-binding domain